MADNVKVAEWLALNIDSHTLYDVELLKELEPMGVEYIAARSALTADGKAVMLATQTMDRLVKTQGAEQTGNPKGVYPEPGYDPTVVVFAGYWLSASLDKLLTGEDAGASKMGRGFAFRANVEHLRGEA